MPSRPSSRTTPLFTVTNDTLVAVDFGPCTGGRPPGPYRRLFQVPGARAFTVGNLVARLPMGMFSVSAVLMIAGARGSYALAGAVTATGLAATALVAPWTARLVDRHGQARIAVPATLLAATGSLALLLCVRYGAPDWTLFASYAATATTPNTGGMSRARWTYLLRGDAAALHTANSFEQAADELCFMIGPVFAVFLCGTFFPEAGTLAGAILLVSGVLFFAAQRSTEPPLAHSATAAPAGGAHSAAAAATPDEAPSATAAPAGESRSTGRTGEAHSATAAPRPPRPRGRTPGRPSPPSLLRAPGMPPLLAVCLVMGVVFGAMEVVTIAFADAHGHRSAAGPVLGLQAAGSCAAGLLYGAVRPAGSAAGRYVWCIAAMTALLTLPLLAAALTCSLPLLAAALLVAGMATAPTMVTGMTLVQHRTPAGRLNEGMTLAVTGLLGGIAAGSAVGGWMVEHRSPAAGYGVPVTAAAVALLIALAQRGSARGTGGDSRTPH
ncbi:MFS transporter [Streptomyces sp. NPDC005574]|uniref:MFS transporter n=1 Tax=Streptomyces sp. NPDC005574 TaxID=3156891 RepID=UPI0033B5A8AA